MGSTPLSSTNFISKGEDEMAKYYDATKEHAPVDKQSRKDAKGRHPNKNKQGKPPSVVR